MKSIASFFGSVAQSVRRQASSGSKHKLVFKAYDNGDYEQMFKLLQQMTPTQFLKDCRRDEMTLVHLCANDDNIEGLSALCQLPYIYEVINDNQNEQGWTPLLKAASRSNKTDLKLIHLLYQHGADLTLVKKEDGMSALHIAASTNDIQLSDFIISNIYEERTNFVNQKNKEGWSAAHFAAFLNNFDSLNLLLDYGADILLKNDSNMTPVDEIIRNDHKDLFSCIYDKVKQHNRDLSIPGSFGYMHMAASQDDSSILQYLLEEQKETSNEICNIYHQATPLHFAVLSNKYYNAKVLLKNGAIPNQRDADGNTPLHLAVAQRNLQMVRLLSQYYADATIENLDKISAYDIAVTEDLKDIKLHLMTHLNSN